MKGWSKDQFKLVVQNGEGLIVVLGDICSLEHQ
jgi:hypothetical protein